MKIVKSDAVPWADSLQRGKYGQRRKDLGGDKLRSGLWELAPGKKSFPLHAHQVTEEALFVLSGHAKVRTPEGLAELGPGDYVSFPAGGPAHQLINDGTEPFRYVGLSAIFGYDAVDYPESGKMGFVVGSPPNARRFIFRKDQPADYFDGDPDA